MTIEGKKEGCLEELHAIVHGRVQGVCFREYTRKQALRLEIKGTVKNLKDGTVEIYAQGSKECLKMLLKNVKIGPSLGFVDKIDVEYSQMQKPLKDFQIIF